MGLDMTLYKTKKGNKPKANDLEIAYWRKFNALHNYFVTNFQNGEDNCTPSNPISKQDFENLITVLREDNLAPIEGFFFGSTDKDEWYHEQRKNAIIEIKNIINETDWDTEFVYYCASW